MDECEIPQEVASLLSGPSLFLGLTDGYRATSSASRRSSFGSRNTCALIRLPTPPYSCMYLYLYPYSYLQLPNLWLCWNLIRVQLFQLEDLRTQKINDVVKVIQRGTSPIIATQTGTGTSTSTSTGAGVYMGKTKRSC